MLRASLRLAWQEGQKSLVLQEKVRRNSPLNPSPVKWNIQGLRAAPRRSASGSRYLLKPPKELRHNRGEELIMRIFSTWHMRVFTICALVTRNASTSWAKIRTRAASLKMGTGWKKPSLVRLPWAAKYRNGKRLMSGVYFLRLDRGDVVRTAKVVVARWRTRDRRRRAIRPEPP
jgi:hypothetical protein